MGKTRTCQRYGWDYLGEYVGGIWFCDLSPIRDLDGLLRAVAQGLDTPLAAQEPARQIAEAIAGRGNCLVVLDNFEHLVAHAESSVGLWLDKAPQAKKFFATLDSANRYAVLFRIQTAKKEETRVKKIKQMVEMLARQEKIHP